MEVSDVLDAVDMVGYMSQFCDFEEKGGELWALSPFKDEKTPSFSVNPEKKFWYDFSSGLGGNLLDFVMKFHGVTIVPAINMLKQYAGLTDEVTNITVRLSASKVAKKYKHNEKALKPASSIILPDDYMDRYEFDRDKLRLWEDEGISLDVMRHFGVRYSAFDDRIVYPVKNYDGKIISVCGRTCDPDFKEKKLRKYTYFQSLGSIDTIYGYSDNKTSILSRKEIILFEGAKSVMLAYGWGVKNGCAILTSHLSDHQFQFLVKLSSFEHVRIVFALDAEIDITKDKNIQRLTRYARVEWIKNFDSLLDDKDSPTDKGYDTFLKLYKGRRRLS